MDQETRPSAGTITVSRTVSDGRTYWRKKEITFRHDAPDAEICDLAARAEWAQSLLDDFTPPPTPPSAPPPPPASDDDTPFNEPAPAPRPPAPAWQTRCTPGERAFLTALCERAFLTALYTMLEELEEADADAVAVADPVDDAGDGDGWTDPLYVDNHAADSTDPGYDDEEEAGDDDEADDDQETVIAVDDGDDLNIPF